MRKYDLLRSGDSIIRVLEMQGDSVLVIDCIKRTMPVWVDKVSLESYSECTIGELSEATGFITVEIDDLDAGQRQQIIRYRRQRSGIISVCTCPTWMWLSWLLSVERIIER